MDDANGENSYVNNYLPSAARNMPAKTGISGPSSGRENL